MLTTEAALTDTVKQGEDFRDDLRVTTTPLKAKQLPPGRLKKLISINDWRSAFSIFQTLMLLLTALAVALLVWQPVFLVIAVVVIGTQQHALIVLAHDATHYRLFKTRTLNDLIGCICGTMAGISMRTYRIIHRLHHNHLYQEKDPDIPLHGGYPRGRAYLVRKLLQDLCGLTTWKTYGYFFGKLSSKTEKEECNRLLEDTSSRLLRAARIDRYIVATAHLTALATSILFGFALEYLVLWILPLATVVPTLLRLRALCEHGAVLNFSSALTAARTNYPSKWFQWLLFPHHVNYHLEHHVYPAIPHYNLPACHQQMMQLGMLDNAEVRTIGKTLGMLFSDPSEDS